MKEETLKDGMAGLQSILTLKVDNTKIKVKSYQGNQKNMLLIAHGLSFKSIPLFIAEILLKPEALTKMLINRPCA